MRSPEPRPGCGGCDALSAEGRCCGLKPGRASRAVRIPHPPLGADDDEGEFFCNQEEVLAGAGVAGAAALERFDTLLQIDGSRFEDDEEEEEACASRALLGEAAARLTRPWPLPSALYPASNTSSVAVGGEGGRGRR